MTAHLSPDTVVAYRDRRLPPDEFLAADRHVAACAACATAVAAVPAADPSAFVLDDAAAADSHLSYDTLEALVDGRATDVDREIAEAHLDGCPSCTEALADLTRFGATMAESARAAAAPPHVPLPLWRRYAVPAAAAAVIALALVVPRLARSPELESPGAGRPRPNASPATSTPGGAVAAPRTATGTPAPVSPPVTAATPVLAPGLDEPRRGGAREVAGKRFRFVAGEWIDESYDRGARLPEVRVTSAVERTALESKVPALTPFSALGRRVTVVVEGTVYVFDVAE